MGEPSMVDNRGGLIRKTLHRVPEQCFGIVELTRLAQRLRPGDETHGVLRRR